MFKVAEMTYHENWNLINKLYKYFGNVEKEKSTNGDRWSVKNNENKVDTSFSQIMMMVNPLSTPMKMPKLPEEKGNMRWQTANTI